MLHFNTDQYFQKWHQFLKTVERHSDTVPVTDNHSAELHIKYAVFKPYHIIQHIVHLLIFLHIMFDTNTKSPCGVTKPLQSLVLHNQI